MQTSGLYINQGETFSGNLNAINNNSVLNLTNYFVRSQIRPRYSATGVYNFTTGLVSASNGVFYLSMPSSGTQNLPAGILLYDVEAYTTGISGIDSQVLKLVGGKVNVSPEVTR